MKEMLHRDVVDAERTCWACPEQWEGEFWDGRKFYFRYRSGWASLKTWIENEPEKATNARTQYGDNLQGIFPSDSIREAIFLELWDLTQMGMQE